MKTYKTEKDTLIMMKTIESTCEFIGEYAYDLNGEMITGYNYCKMLNGPDSPCVPVALVMCSNGFFYSTDWKDLKKIFA